MQEEIPKIHLLPALSLVQSCQELLTRGDSVTRCAVFNLAETQNQGTFQGPPPQHKELSPVPSREPSALPGAQYPPVSRAIRQVTSLHPGLGPSMLMLPSGEMVS